MKEKKAKGTLKTMRENMDRASETLENINERKSE